MDDDGGGWVAERQQQLVELLREMGELAVATGPQGAVRLLQGMQAVAAVGAGWVQEQAQVGSRQLAVGSG